MHHRQVRVGHVADEDPVDTDQELLLEGRLSERGVRLERVGKGVSRVSWTADLQEQGFETASAAVRTGVDLALDELDQKRVEALVDPDDVTATRIATWAGMRREGVMRGAVER